MWERFDESQAQAAAQPGATLTILIGLTHPSMTARSEQASLDAATGDDKLQIAPPGGLGLLVHFQPAGFTKTLNASVLLTEVESIFLCMG